LSAEDCAGILPVWLCITVKNLAKTAGCTCRNLSTENFDS